MVWKQLWKKSFFSPWGPWWTHHWPPLCVGWPALWLHQVTTYHAVYWSYRASRADRWFLPRSIPWVPGLPEVAHSMTEDPEDRGYRSTRLWGQWQLQSVSISNGDGRWPVCSPGVWGQGTATQQHRNKQKQGLLRPAQSGNQGTKQPACGEARADSPWFAYPRHRGDVQCP